MAVTEELLQMDLYALLGIEEKAADKEVRTVARRADPRGLVALPVLAPSPRPASAFQVRPGSGRGATSGLTASEGGLPDRSML